MYRGILDTIIYNNNANKVSQFNNQFFLSYLDTDMLKNRVDLKDSFLRLIELYTNKTGNTELLELPKIEKQLVELNNKIRIIKLEQEKKCLEKEELLEKLKKVYNMPAIDFDGINNIINKDKNISNEFLSTNEKLIVLINDLNKSTNKHEELLSVNQNQKHKVVEQIEGFKNTNERNKKTGNRVFKNIDLYSLYDEYEKKIGTYLPIKELASIYTNYVFEEMQREIIFYEKDLLQITNTLAGVAYLEKQESLPERIGYKGNSLLIKAKQSNIETEMLFSITNDIFPKIYNNPQAINYLVNSLDKIKTYHDKLINYTNQSDIHLMNSDSEKQDFTSVELEYNNYQSQLKNVEKSNILLTPVNAIINMFEVIKDNRIIIERKEQIPNSEIITGKFI